MIIGMDFGTTNSGIAAWDGNQVRVLPLDPDNPNPRVIRTALYLTNDQTVRIGRTAVNAYYSHNVGRPVQMRRVWIGELEIFGADMYFVTDAYAWIDILSPGRLFLSIKSSLRDADYPGTVVGQFYYPLENLVALYLMVTKARAEEMLQRPLPHVVLGRPVHFATDPTHDRLAQSRLLQAAFRAGYEKVYFQYEPIAAAFSYETSLHQEQNVLIFDFGGGTLDITIMRLGHPKRRQVLATGGIPVAGDLFDQKLVRAKLPPHFGEGSLYGPRHEPRAVPNWIYDSFSDWQKLLELQSAENKQILREIAQTSRRKYQIEALTSLVSSNYGLKLFDAMEQVKRTLSDKRGAEIRLQGPGFDITDFVTRSEFEGLIRQEIRDIEHHLQETVTASGLRPEQIDAVIRTGGSAQIPAFYDLLCRLFGREKVQSIDPFSSVTAGLGIVAHNLEVGDLDLKAYTPQDVKITADPDKYRPTVSPANLDVLQRRILLAERVSGRELAVDMMALVFIDGVGRVTAVSLPATALQPDAPPLSLPDLALPALPRQVCQLPLSDRLLLLTNTYRFLLSTPRQLLDLQQANLALTQQYPLGPIEHLCLLGNWDRMRSQERLVLVTALGLIRPYPLEVLRGNVEAPVPYQFDHPLSSDPILVSGAVMADELLLVTNTGRGVRCPLANLRLAGIQAQNCGAEDRVVAAALVRPDTDVLLLTADGYGRRLPANWVPIPPKANAKGKTLIMRRSAVVGVTAVTDKPIWAVTTHRLLPLSLPPRPATDSTAAQRLLPLLPGETVLAMVTTQSHQF